MWKSRSPRPPDNPPQDRVIRTRGPGAPVNRIEPPNERPQAKPAPVKVNRAQLLIGGAIAFVLAGTTAFVFLREAVPTDSSPPEIALNTPAVPPSPAPPPAATQPPVPAQPTSAPPPAAEIPAPPPAAQAVVTPPQPKVMAPPPAPPKEVASIPQAAPPLAAPETPKPRATAKPEVAEPEAAQEPAPPPHASRPVQSAHGKYALQLGSFLVANNATALVARMEKSGRSAQDKIETDRNGKAWHKVRVGPYASRADAETDAQLLKANEKVNPVVVETDDASP